MDAVCPRNLESFARCFTHLALILHVITGQWLVYVLILIHLGATAWHVIVHRDGVLERMLPQQMEFTPQEPATVLDGD